MAINLSRFIFIEGAPRGVCATLIPSHIFIGQTCTECEAVINENDSEVWFCAPLRAVWHKDCLKPGPTTTKVFNTLKKYYPSLFPLGKKNDE